VTRPRHTADAGQLSRREFVQRAILLALSATPTQARERSGGTLRIGQMVARMFDPATYAWVEMSNQTRPMCECLTVLGTDNVVRPWLLESWSPSPDLKSWVLNVRPGVRWHNGEELSAGHVAWNIRRWIDPRVGSVNRGLSTFAALRTETGESVEVLDTHTLRLNLAQPVLSVPEDFAEYSTHIVHPSFRPPLSKNPMGTGPYTLAELRVADRCILHRVTHTTDGKPFDYWGGEVLLDEIHFYNFEQDNQVAALASGSVDLIYELNVDQLELAQSIPGARIASVDTAQTICLRMQVDAKPFDDIRVRRAIVTATDNDAIRQLVFGHYASIAGNYHVAPIHPEYFALPVPPRDVAAARRLLKEAGYASGLDLTIAVGNNDGPWHQAICEALRDQLKEVGIRLHVEVLPPTRYWEVWNKVPFGATSWSHRPLGTMALSQAYRTGAAWNETHYSDPEFDRALSDAEAVLDPAQRRAKMQRVEQILRDAAVMVQPLWRPVFGLSSERVHGYRPHPARQMHLNTVWVS
jgi:peptide/nickel transport system substrate-binding protein